MANGRRKARFDPSFIITHRGTLEDGPGFYDTFKNKKDNCIKCVMHPGQARVAA